MLKPNFEEIDLGELKFGEPKHFNFILTNTSETPIEINRLIMGCMSCTTARASKQIVLPKEDVSIDAVFTPGSTGIASKSIYVIWNNRELKLKFKANISAKN
jgi:hypothetical protein